MGVKKQRALYYTYVVDTLGRRVTAWQKNLEKSGTVQYIGTLGSWEVPPV